MKVCVKGQEYGCHRKTKAMFCYNQNTFSSVTFNNCNDRSHIDENLYLRLLQEPVLTIYGKKGDSISTIKY